MSEPHQRKKNLSVRTKILLAIIASVLGLSVLIYLISTQVLLKSYVSIERTSMEQDLSRAVDAIKEFSNQQMIKLSDWAAWDEAYNYTKNRDPKWPPTTIYPSSMANLDNNLGMFTDLNGKIFHIMMSDITKREEVSHESVATYFAEHSKLVTHTELESSTEGIIMLPEGPMLIVSLPVTNSQGEGPIFGALTFGRYLDAEKVTALGEITHLKLSAYRYDAVDLPSDVLSAKEKLSGGQQYVVTPISPTALYGYALLKDVNDEPALILRVDETRPIYTQGNVSLITYLGIGAIALILFGAAILLLLEQVVISRFLRLSDEMSKINTVRDLSIRVKSDVADEVGSLADKINQLLSWLSEAREAEAASRREIVNLLDELKKEKEQTEEMNRILSMRKP